MFKTLLPAAALAVLMTSSAHASITVDGVLDADYGSPTATVAYDPTAPEGNFGSPGPSSDAIGYSIHLKAENGFVYGFLQASGTGAPVGGFANLYWDLDPAANDGSDLGFEITNNDAFIPGGNGPVTLTGANAIQYFVSADDKTVEFAIPDVDFTTKIAGLNYTSDQPTKGGDIVLRISQSFGYSAAGGGTYGDNRLGVVTVPGVPEPATWAMMLAGFGGMGIALRSRRKPVAATA